MYTTYWCTHLCFALQYIVEIISLGHQLAVKLINLFVQLGHLSTTSTTNTVSEIMS